MYIYLSSQEKHSTGYKTPKTISRAEWMERGVGKCRFRHINEETAQVESVWSPVTRDWPAGGGGGCAGPFEKKIPFGIGGQKFKRHSTCQNE